MQPVLRGQLLMKMEASASSAISTEEKEPPKAWPMTISTQVQQLLADVDHLRGWFCSSLSFSATAPTCSPAAEHITFGRQGGVHRHG